jgi:adenylate kinase
MLNIVLFGPPGAGKGTQSERIIEKYKLIHLSTGDLFRKHLSEGTELGKIAQRFIDEGNLVPDEVVIYMVEDKIGTAKNPKGFIFDGFPRTVAQAEALDVMLAKYNAPIRLMLALDVDDDELRTRLRLRGKTSGRTDDQDDQKINNRIQVYKNQTLPVAAYYESHGKHEKVKGVGSINDIFENLCKVIDKYADN